MDAIPIEPVWNEQSNKQNTIHNLSDTANCPCDNCEYYAKCKEQEIACQRFAKWQFRKDVRWEFFDNVPNKKQYNKIY